MGRGLAFVAVSLVVIIVGLAVTVRLLGASLGTVTSWWRNPLHNSEVGGLPGSAHLLGWAVDIVPVTPEIEAQARKTFPVVVNEGSHIHAAIFRA